MGKDARKADVLKAKENECTDDVIVYDRQHTVDVDRKITDIYKHNVLLRCKIFFIFRKFDNI